MKILDIFESFTDGSLYAIKPIFDSIQKINSILKSKKIPLNIEFDSHFAERCHERNITAIEVGKILIEMIKQLAPMTEEKKQYLSSTGTIEFKDDSSTLFVPILLIKSGDKFDIVLKTIFSNTRSMGDFQVLTGLKSRSGKTDLATFDQAHLAQIGRSYKDGWNGESTGE